MSPAQSAVRIARATTLNTTKHFLAQPLDLYDAEVWFVGGVYLGAVTFVNPNIPHNEGMYRPISVDLGPKGTIVNALEPAACGMSTSTPYDHIAEAIRDALAKAMPKRAGAGWAKICQDVFTGIDPRNGDHCAYLSHFIWGGGGAFWGQDGEPAVGPLEVAGAAMTGNVETIEHMLPLHVSRFELDPESASAGRWRGGWGTILEIGPVDHTTQVNFLGDGMKYPPPSLLGAHSPRNVNRVYRKHPIGPDGTERMKLHTVRKILSSHYLEIHNPGGGGIGDPFARDSRAVMEDVRSGLLSAECAREDYGVVIDQNGLTLDTEATARSGKPGSHKLHNSSQNSRFTNLKEQTHDNSKFSKTRRWIAIKKPASQVGRPAAPRPPLRGHP